MPWFDLIVQGIGLVSAGAVAGGILLFASVIAPVTFAVLDAGAGQRFLRGVFPRYYLFLIVTSAVGALAIVAKHPRLGMLMAAIALSTVVIRQLVMPAINRARDAELAGDEAAGRRFRLLHRAAVIVNVAQLLVAIVVMARLAF
jgi:hypothetical protein